LIGAAISGVIYTYTIHLFSSLRKTESIEETIKIVFKPLFFGALITSCVFFFLMFSNSSVLKNVGLFGGLFIIGGLIGLLLVLPVIIQNKIKFRGKPISFDLGLFAIKNKLIRTGIVLVLIGVTIWFGFKMTDIKINSLDLIQNAKHIYIGFGIILVLLIMIYGRIEYALITFLPMVMSWIWTFGITSLIGLELNEYLIFVFSLIFGFTVGSTVLISDSYKSIYSYGDSSKNSSSTSILMVGTILLSTILILLVSDNPTMKSLALFTVISCLCFMLFSLFFQS
jgi:predicted RND superfamily exporter protein